MLNAKQLTAWAKTQHLDTLRALVQQKDAWQFEEHDEEMLREALMEHLKKGIVGSNFYGPGQCIGELCEALEALNGFEEVETPEEFVAYFAKYA